MVSSLFHGTGLASRAQADFDWAAHPLGAPEQWPDALRAAVRFIMAAPESMYLAWGPEQFFIFNDAYVPALGPRLAEAAGSTLPTLWADVYDQVKPIVLAAQRGQSSRFEDIALNMARSGGSEDTWWSFFFTPVFNGDGVVLGVLCQTNETTARVQRARRMRVLEQQHQALAAEVEGQVAQRASERGRIWEVSPDLLAVSATGDYFDTTNPAWQRILGWDAVALVTMAFPNLVHPDDVAMTHDALVRAKASGEVQRFVSRLKTRGGRYRTIAWTAVAHDGQVFFSGRDVTDEQAQAQALAQSEQELRQAQKMEAVGQLTGGLAHDFNNLLGGVMGSIELAQTRIAAGRGNDVDGLLAGAIGATKRAAALTHRLLAFSRQQTLDPKPTDINRLVLGMEELIARTVGAHIKVEVITAAGLWSVFADPSQVDNALLNLCINARDAMPDGGTLTIETGNRWIDQHTAEGRGLVAGQYVSLCVSDTGTGMPAEVVARAFDPFFTTKPLGQGTGLGLSMIHEFAKQSEGDVRIYSEAGAGTTVCLYLPRHLGEGEMAETHDAGPMAVGDGQTILVVDDEPTIRGVVVEQLAAQGYTMLDAPDGPTALRVLAAHPEVALLITDVGLPGGMNGRQVADAARALHSDLLILFITGYAENAVLSHGHLVPGMEVLTKPFALADLARRVEHLLPH